MQSLDTYSKMNIIALSDQQLNMFFCYKLAKTTGNEDKFNITTLNKENRSIKISINHNNNDHMVKLWTSTNNITEKNNGYVILLSEMEEDEYSKKALEITDRISSYDQNYKFILIINVVDVSKYRMENRNVYIAPLVGKKLGKPFKADELINPCAFACSNRLYSIAAQLSNNDHFNSIAELVASMATEWNEKN
jgi:hypothetical protein